MTLTRRIRLRHVHLTDGPLTLILTPVRGEENPQHIEV
jgi:hypothetical protein